MALTYDPFAVARTFLQMMNPELEPTPPQPKISDRLPQEGTELNPPVQPLASQVPANQTVAKTPGPMQMPPMAQPEDFAEQVVEAAPTDAILGAPTPMAQPQPQQGMGGSGSIFGLNDMLGLSPALRLAMAQFGMNLLTPSPGGWGADLAGAVQTYGHALAPQQPDLAQQKSLAEIEALRALTDQRRESSQTERVRRTTGLPRAGGVGGGSTQMERFAAELGLSAAGALYLKERLSQFDAFSEGTSLREALPGIVEEARLLDQATGGTATGQQQGAAEQQLPPIGGTWTDPETGKKWKRTGPGQRDWEQIGGTTPKSGKAQ